MDKIFGLEGKVAVVSASTKGIGLASAKALASQGAKVYLAVRNEKLADQVIRVCSLIGLSFPNFWLAMMLILVFCSKLGWLPSHGMYTSGEIFFTAGQKISDVARHMILPVICLSTIPTATFTRITRSSMLETINSDYIKALRSRGLSERIIIFRHALKNALPPIVTVVGIQLAGAFTGAILTETIFSWPGVGNWLLDGFFTRDYPIVQNGILLVATALIFISLLVDILYGVINPRIRHAA